MYLYSINLGMKAIFEGKLNNETIKRVVCPMDPSRYYELATIVKNLKLKPKQIVLDISSPKLITYYLSNKYPNTIFYATDIYKHELDIWKNSFGIPSNIVFEVQDATNLTYTKNKFDYVYSVSVIEHIDKKGKMADKIAVNQVKRVLKKSGSFLFTTMISNHYSEVFSEGNMYSQNKKKRLRHFFYRVYDYKSLVGRLIKNKGIRLRYEEVCNYRLPFLEKIFNYLTPLSALFGFLNIFYAPFVISISLPNDIKPRAEYFGIFVKTSK